MSYAQGTTTPVPRSREELQRVLEKAGVEEVMFYSGAGGRARVAFRLGGLLRTIDVPAVDKVELAKKLGVRRKFRRLPTWTAPRWVEPHELVDHAAAAEERRRWRALLLVVKAKLEAVASGISTLEEEFLANVQLANGRTLAAELRPRLAALAADPNGPRLLLEDPELGARP